MARLLVALIVGAVPVAVSNSRHVVATTQGPLKPLTVCEVLQTLKSLNGQLVAVVGRYQPTEEAWCLGADCCIPPLKTYGYQWPNIISLEVDVSNQSGSWTQIALETEGLRRALREASRHTALTHPSHRWAVVYGRLETRERLTWVTDGAGEAVYGYGFGHLNAAPAQLVFSFKNMKVFSESEVQELLKTG